MFPRIKANIKKGLITIMIKKPLEIAQTIEHVWPKINLSYMDLENLCKEAIQYNFKTVAIGQAYVAFCKNILKETPVHVSAGISFPFGQTSIEAKLFEAKDAIKSGADEIEYVVNFAEVNKRNREYVKTEMNEIVIEARKHHVISKVIFETCYLNNDTIIWLCDIASEVKPDYVKTTTGFGSRGATVADVALMRKHTPSDISIKAAAGIRDLKTLLQMVEAGASRIGTSSGVSIMKEVQKVD